tara:strand:+ start:627 stop:914 length:288 start_codon:yes stop_codon:yes gene_type:complete
MNATHPIQMVLGSLIIQEELAMKNGQTTFAILAEDCAEWARDSRESFCEIERRAGNMVSRIDLYASDGVFKNAEREQLSEDATKIETIAREGIAQ